MRRTTKRVRRSSAQVAARPKRKKKITQRSLDFFAARKRGEYGRGSKEKCDGCGMTYETFRGELDFGTARREFIAIGFDKDGKRLHGRRNAVLGKMKQRKRQMWAVHVGQCTDNNEAARAAVGTRKGGQLR